MSVSHNFFYLDHHIGFQFADVIAKFTSLYGLGDIPTLLYLSQNSFFKTPKPKKQFFFFSSQQSMREPQAKKLITNKLWEVEPDQVV